MAELPLEQAPRKARDLFDKGFAAMERGNLDYAIDMFLATLELEPRLLRARQFLRAAEVKKMKGGKSSSLTKGVSTLQGMGSMASVNMLLKKDPTKALQAAEKLMRINPLNPPFVNLLVSAAEACDMPEVAIQSLEIARDHDRKNIKFVEKLAKLYQDVGETHKARDCYEEIARARPTDPQAIKNLKDATALDTMNKGGWEEAGSYRDVMKDTDGAKILEQQSKAVKSSSDIDELIISTQAKIQREPDNVNYRRALADLYTKAERYDDALEALTAARESIGADPQIDQDISLLHIKKFDVEIERLEASGDGAALAMKNEEKRNFILGDAQDKVKRYPNDLQFRYNLGVLLYERGDINDAIQQFQRSQQNPARRVRSLYYMALCFKQKEQYDIAVEQLEKAASEIHSMDNTKKDIYYQLGLLHELMGHADEAAKYFKDIYAVDIGYMDVAEKIDNVYKKKS